MREGLLHEAVICSDVCKFSARDTGACGLTAGFPCQAGSDCIVSPIVSHVRSVMKMLL